MFSRVVKVAAGLFLWSIAATAGAASVIFDIGSSGGAVPGFSGSYLHGATSCDADGYCASGPRFSITGELTFSNATIDSIDDTITGASNVTGYVQGTSNAGIAGLPNGEWRLNITSGSFPSSTSLPNGDGVLLMLNYDLFDVSAAGNEDLMDPMNITDQGTFYFAQQDFNGSSNPSPNSISLTHLILWGNNWMNGGALPSLAGRPDLGIDLFAGGGTVVPLPPAFLLFGSALVGLYGWRRRQNRLSA